MPRPEVVFHPGASEDYEEAFAWYLSRGATLALDFEREVERCLRLIVEAPLRWPAFAPRDDGSSCESFPMPLSMRPSASRSWSWP